MGPLSSLQSRGPVLPAAETASNYVLYDYAALTRFDSYVHTLVRAIVMVGS